MAFADLDALLNAMKSPLTFPYLKSGANGAGGSYAWASLLKSASGIPVGPGTIPGASAVCNSASAGALGQANAGSGDWFASLSDVCFGLTTGLTSRGGMIMLADRLVEMGGLSGTSTAGQSVATSVLTRYTDGVGVIACAEIYTAIGTTATTVTLDYTDDAGNPGQTSQPTVLGGAIAAGRTSQRQLVPLSLAVGDKGVRAVNTATLLATTGTAGDWGITLLKPLLLVPFGLGDGGLGSPDPLRVLGGYLPMVVDDACLQLIVISTAISSQHSAMIHLVEA